MSDQPEEQDGGAERSTWSETPATPAWENIAGAAESAASGPAGPDASSHGSADVPTEVYDVPGMEPDGEPATEAGRSRRPTSLRDQYIKSDDDVPRRKLSPPAFPSAPGIPGSRVDTPVSEAGEMGKPEQVTDFAPDSEPSHGGAPTAGREPGPSLKQRLDKLPLDKLTLDKLSVPSLPLDKLPRPKLSRDKAPTDEPVADRLPTAKLPTGKLGALTKQRPEVGIGLAFAGGLLIATIVKRLGRK